MFIALEKYSTGKGKNKSGPSGGPGWNRIFVYNSVQIRIKKEEKIRTVWKVHAKMFVKGNMKKRRASKAACSPVVVDLKLFCN